MIKFIPMAAMRPLILVATILFSLTSIDWASAQPTSNSTADTATTNKALVLRLYKEVFNTGNFDKIDSFLSPNYVDHNPVGTKSKSGTESLKQTLVAMRSAFPDLHFSVHEMMATEDKVICRTTVRGTHGGPFIVGVAPTGKRVLATEIGIYRITNGKIVERWGTLDGLAMMQQLGVIQMMPQPSMTKQNKSAQTTPQKSGASEKRKKGYRLTNLESFEQLKTLFEADSNTVRLVALLSPN